MTSTFVYVSNALDGDIGLHRLLDNGALQPGARFAAGDRVGPLAVSPDQRFLYAASRAEPFSVRGYGIDHRSGTLTLQSTTPVLESFPYITVDRTGRVLLGASYGGNLVTVNAIGADGAVVAPAAQIIPTARNAHAIVVDRSNRYVYVPHLGTDQLLQFVFDASAPRLSANTPPLVQLEAGTGPRHLVISNDNRFAYLLNELVATVTIFALDASSGLLTAKGTARALPADSTLQPGAPRGPGAATRDVSKDIWAADLHLTPNGRFLYASERTSSSITTFGVDSESGSLTCLGNTPTEPQPRGFAIDPSGRFLVASGERSETITLYAIDPSSGALRVLGKYPTGKGSNWVSIVAFD